MHSINKKITWLRPLGEILVIIMILSDGENLVAIMGTDLRGGVSWLEEECRDRSETKWITEARFVCSCSTCRMMVLMMMVMVVMDQSLKFL